MNLDSWPVAVIHRNGQIVSACSDAPTTVLGALVTARHVIASDNHGNASLIAEHESLANNATPRPNAGLITIVAYRLLQSRIRPAVVGQPTVRALPPPALNNIPDHHPVDAAVLHFVSERSHGLIHYRTGVSRARIIAQMTQAWPHATFAIATASHGEAQRLRRQLYELGVKTTSVTTRWCPEHPGRIVIGTYAALGHTQVECNKRDFFVAANATHALGEQAQRCLLQVDAGFRLFGFVSEDVRFSPWEQDWLTATFGLDEIYVPGYAHQQVTPQVVWAPFRWHAQEGNGGNGKAVAQPQLIWRNHVRNRRIARLARALVAGDHTAIVTDAPDVAPALAANDARRVIILVDGVDHAVALAERLADWPIVTGDHVETRGLVSRQRRLLTAGTSRWVTGASTIVTTAGASRLDLGDGQTMIIWASAGRHLPPLPPAWRMARTGEARELLLMDIDDRGSGPLVEWKRHRQAAYRRADWLPPGTDLLTARIERFLAERPKRNG